MLKDYFSRYLVNGNALMKILFINVSVFLVLHIINIFFHLFNIEGFFVLVVKWLSLHSDIRLLLVRPWTLLTHMFLHIDFFHILWNMLLLYMAGQIFLEYLGSNRLASLYILGGLCGVLFYMLAYNLFPRFETILSGSYAFGASAGVLAILVAIAFYVPDYTVQLLIFGRVKLIYIAAIFIILDIVNFDKANTGGHIAHLGGAIFGYLYISQYKRGKDWTKGLNQLLRKLKSPFQHKREKVKMKVAYKKRRVSDEEYNSLRVAQQHEIDAILDKISKSGYDSLSKAEKETLFRLSNQDKKH